MTPSHSTHPDAVFGPDEPIVPAPEPKSGVTYADVVSYLKDVNTRALTNDDADDVIRLLDYMHDHCLKLFDKQMQHEARLDEREALLTRREAELAVKQRAVDTILKMHPQASEPAPKRRYFWR